MNLGDVFRKIWRYVDDQWITWTGKPIFHKATNKFLRGFYTRPVNTWGKWGQDGMTMILGARAVKKLIGKVNVGDILGVDQNVWRVTNLQTVDSTLGSSRVQLLLQPYAELHTVARERAEGVLGWFLRLKVDSPHYPEVMHYFYHYTCEGTVPGGDTVYQGEEYLQALVQYYRVAGKWGLPMQKADYSIAYEKEINPVG